MEVQFKFEDSVYRVEENLQAKWGDDWKKKIFEIVTSNVIAQVHPQGLRGPQARSYNRVLIQLDLAKGDSMELETADAEFLKSIVFHENAAIVPGQVPVFCKIQDAVDAAFARAKE